MVNSSLMLGTRGGPERLLLRRANGLFASLLVVLGGILVAYWLGQEPVKITGTVRVIDGDSLVVGGQTIRLHGIDAVELQQTCERTTGAWRCGQNARDALREAVNGHDVICRARDRDRYARTVASCRVGDRDLGGYMVASGLAVGYGAYHAEEKDARQWRRGIWAGTFENPAAWRSHHGREGR